MFAIVAPTLWHSLLGIRPVETIAHFFFHLKTYLYNLVYPP